MKTKISYKILSIVLAVIMIISSVNISSFAATAETASPTNANEPTTTSTEVTTETSTESTNVDDENYIIFDHLFSDIDTSLITTNQLFVTTSDSSIFTKNTNVVSNYDDAYIIDCESVEEAQYVYSYYVDKVDFISDLSNQIELSDNETTEQSEDDVADMSEVNENSDDAIANLNTAVEEMEQTIEEDKELDEKTGYEGYIALIDSGVELTEKDNLDAPDVSISLVDEEPEKDSTKSKHGTLMYKYIKEENPDAKVISIKAFDGKTTNTANIYAAIQYAIEAKVSVINLSFIGADIEENAIIKDIIKEAVKNKITVIGAAGNNSESSKLYIPGNVEEAITIGAVNEDGTLYKTSNFDADLYVVATSTSEATARYSGIFAGNIISDKVFQKITDNTEDATISDATDTDATELPIDTDKIDFSKLETVDFNMIVKYLIIDNSFGINTINDVYSEEGNNIESFIHQISIGPEVYNIDDTYYAVKLDLAKNKNISNSIADYVFANGNDYGEVVTDNVYVDRKNYVAIFKKDAFNKKDGNFSDGQVQVLVPTNYKDNIEYPVQINYFNKYNKSIGSETTYVNLLETLDIDLSNNINNISEIRLNDEETSLIKSEDYDIEGTNLQFKITSDNYYKIDIYINTEDTFIVAQTRSSDQNVNIKDVTTSSIKNISDGYSKTVRGTASHNDSGSSGTLYDYSWGVSTQYSDVKWRLKFKFLGKNWDLPAICAHVSNNSSRYPDASSDVKGYGSADIHIHCVNTSTSGNYDYYYFIAYTHRPVCKPVQAAATYFAVRVKRGSYLYSTKVAEDKSTALRNVVFVVENKNGDYIGYAKSSNNKPANFSNVYKAAAVENAQWDDSNFQTSGGGVNVSAGTTLKLAERGYPLYECLRYDNGDGKGNITHHNIFGNQLAKNNGINSNYGKCVRNTSSLTVGNKYMYIGNSKIYKFIVDAIDSNGNITVKDLEGCDFTVEDGLAINAKTGKEDWNATSGTYKTLVESALYKTSNGHWYVKPIAKVTDELKMYEPKTFTIATKEYSSNPKRSLLVNSQNEFSFYIYKVSKGYEFELGNASFVVYKLVNNVKNYIGETGYTTNLANAKKFKTNDNGVTGFCDTWLTDTKHYAEEIEAPTGYKKLTNSIELTLNTSGISDDITNDTVIDDIIDAGFAYTKITNSPVDRYIAIKKTDLNGNAISNVKFNITKDSYSNETFVMDGQTIYVPKTGWEHNGLHKVNYASNITLDKTSGVTDANGILVVKISDSEPGLDFPVTFIEAEPTDANVKANVWNYKDENNKYPNQGYKISYCGTGYSTEQEARNNANAAIVKNQNEINIYIQKTSSIPVYIDHNVNYSLAGAEYKLFKYRADAIAAENDVAAGKTDIKNAIFTFTTAKSQNNTYETEIAQLDKLTVNDTHNDFTTYTVGNTTYYDYMNRDTNGVHTNTTFYLVETKAPRGYKRSSMQTITVSANSEVQKFNLTDEPVSDPLSLQVNKYDSFGNKASNITNGKVSVKYSFYEAEMYDKVLSRQEVINSGKLLPAPYSGKVSTNENGEINIRGINFPRGYVVIDEITYPSDFDGKRAVYITKADGTKLDITNDMYFVTDVDFSTPKYERVTYYPNGATTYAQLTGGTGIPFEGGSNVADITVEMYNNAVRGNIELTKINELTGEPMEGVKFSITNVKTGEKHYIFTNAEGKATTKIEYDSTKSFNDNYGPHCNYYDDVVDDDGNIVSTKDYDPTITDATVWFGYDTDNHWVSPDKWKLDSFPDALWGSTDSDNTIGTYIIKEERCAANTNVEVDGKTYKFQLIPTIDTHIFAEHDLNNVYDKNATESDGKIYNTKLPEIHTQARVLDTSQLDSTDESGTTVKDLSQTLANQSTDLIIPETSTDTTKTDDNNTDSDPVEPTEPVDPVEPTVEDDVIVDYTDQTIEDEVFYEKLRAGTKYDVLSKLMLVTEELDETGKPITEPVVDEEGNPVLDENGEPIFKDKITVEQYKYKDGSDAIQMTSFTTSNDYKKSLYEKTGSHVITFEHIDVTGIDEKHQHFVLFEQIYLDDNYSSLEDLQDAINNNTYKTRYDDFTENDDMNFFPLVHEDAYDETQSVYPTIVHTTALNNPTVDHIAHNTKTTITDRVYYRGLTIGKEYTVTGSLVVKEGTDFTNIKYDPKNPDADAEGFVTTTTNTDDTNDNSSKAYFLRNADGKVVTATHTFVATARDGYIDIDFEVDLSDVAGKSTVAFEELKYGNIIVGTHMDLEDEDQTIHVPEIGTLTYNSEIDAEKVCTEHDLDISKDTFEKLKEIYTDDELALAKQIKADKGKSFTDAIHYKNLLANRKYEITGVLKDKATGETMKDASGKDITATMTYTTPEVSEVVIDKSPLAVNYVLEDGTVLDLSGDHADYLCEGNIFLKFEGYDFTNLGNKTGVVFETIKLINEDSKEPENPDEPDTDNTNNLIVATHEDINDVTQFIYFAEVGTEANDDITEKPITPYQQQTYINDRVSYKNVIPGKPYTLTATIHVKNDSTGKYKDGDVLLENGKPVTVTHTFTPTTTDGEEIVQIPVNTINLEGMKLVVFENMENQYHIEVAAHNDLEDDKQTVPVPKARTSASITDFSDMEKITLVDTIKYEKFLVGETYVAKGYLVDENGEKVKIDGEYVTAEQEFVAEKEDDTVDVKFTFNAADLSGKFVVFEEVYIKTTDKETNSPKEVLVAEHKDIKDNNQTVTINMEMKIQIAKGDKDKTNYFLKGAEITVYTTDGKIAKDVDGKDCVGISDENGLVSFNVPYGEYYAMETKAPNGYNISTEKYTIKPTIKGRDDVAIDTIKVTILDTAIVIPPKTGDILLWIFLAIFIISIAGLVLSRKKKLI